MTATRSLIIAAALAALAIAAALAFIMYRPAADTGAPAPPAQTVDDTAAERDAGTSQAAMIAPPVFDIVRVAPVGSAVTAGRGEPGATIQLLADGEPLGFTNEAGEQTDIQTINERGEWVIIPDEPLPSGAIELSLRMVAPDGREMLSEQVVVVSIPEQRGRPRWSWSAVPARRAGSGNARPAWTRKWACWCWRPSTMTPPVR